MDETTGRFGHEVRLGDVIDDYCIKCRRLTNHSVVSILEGKAAKVRCRTCYNDHDNRFEVVPPTKKELKQAELFKEVLAGIVPSADALDPAPDLQADSAPSTDPAEAKKVRGRMKKAVGSQPPVQP